MSLRAELIDIEEARRWLRQANHILEVAKKLLDRACYADSCFYSAQTGQLALKAFLYGQCEGPVRISSVKHLVEQCARHDGTFRQLDDVGRVLDQYYIPTRYPDALAEPAVPFESYTREQASQALGFAQEILGVVKQKIGV